MASTLRSQVCEQERAGRGCLMSEWIALGGCPRWPFAQWSIPAQNDARSLGGDWLTHLQR